MRPILLLTCAVLAGVSSAETIKGSLRWEGEGRFSYSDSIVADELNGKDGGYELTVPPGPHSLTASCGSTNNVYVPEVYVGPGETVDYDIEFDPGYYVNNGTIECGAHRFSQEFIAEPNRNHVVAVSYQRGTDYEYDDLSVRHGGPYGPIIGPTMTVPVGNSWIAHNNGTWSAGLVPLFPGEHYWLDWGTGNRIIRFAINDEWPGVCLYRGSTPSTDDLRGCISQESENTLSLVYCRNTGSHSSLAATWAQTFVGYGDYIAGALFRIQWGDSPLQGFEVRIHEGLDGPQVGPSKMVNYEGRVYTVWRPWEVPIEDGVLYSLQVNIHNPYGTNNYRSLLYDDLEDRYPLGSLHVRSGSGYDPWEDLGVDFGGFVLAVGQLPQIGISDVRVEDVTDDAALVCWTTDVPAQARVLYGVAAPDEGSVVVAYPKVEQAVVLMGLSPGAEYEFLPNSAAQFRRYTEGAAGAFATPAVPRPGVARNWGFERGDTSGWAGFGSGMEAATEAYIGSFAPQEGSHLVYHSVYAGEHDGGLYQTLAAAAGHAYEVRAKAGVYWAQEPELEPFDTRCRVGIDPAGGTDPAGGGVVWGSWVTNPDDWTGAWYDVSVRATASASSMTVFLQYEMDDVKYWRVCCFDDVQVYPVVEGAYGSGWSLLAAPLDPLPGGSMAVSDLFSSDPVNALFRYGAGGYEVYPGDFTELQRGGAYWLYTYGGGAMSYVAARPQGAVSIPLNDGWSLVGSAQVADVPLADCLVTDGAATMSFADAVVAGWLEDTFYGYDGGYVATRPSGGADDALRGGSGYWVLANGPGLVLVVPLP